MSYRPITAAVLRVEALLTRRVYFPITPFVPNEELRRLYEQGVISWDSYATYALRNVSLPLEDKQKGPPPIDELLFEKPKPKEVAGKGKVAAEEGEVKAKAKSEDKKEGRGSPNPETAQTDKKRKSDDKDKSKNKKAKK